MGEIRERVKAVRSGEAVDPANMNGVAKHAEVVAALRTIAENEDVLGNSVDEWRNFFFNGEVQALLETSSS